MNPEISIISELPEFEAQAALLREQLHLGENPHAPIQLRATNGHWALNIQGMHPIWVDFDLRAQGKTRASIQAMGVVKACRPRPGIQILDLTAGLGEDASFLHALGAELTLLERNPVMQVLLEDGLKRLYAYQPQAKLRLIKTDAKAYLNALSAPLYPDIIYFDPMHPVRIKSAKVKKKMQLLQTFILPDEQGPSLLALARQKVKEKVVVKWPARLPPLAPVNHSIEGKTVRYDVYLPASR